MIVLFLGNTADFLTQTTSFEFFDQTVENGIMHVTSDGSLSVLEYS